MKNILLYDLIDTALIIPYKSGIVYSNQVGGTQCYLKSQEGLLIPYTSVNFADKELHSQLLKELFENSEYCAGGVSLEIARKLSDFFANYSMYSGFSIDYENIDNSYEAWVYVNVDLDVNEYLSTIIKGFSINNAILTWPNSD